MGGAPRWAELRALGSSEGSGDRQDPAGLDSLLDEVWEEARSTWRSVRLSKEAFAAHVGARLPGDVSAVAGLRQRNTADLYLACACSAGDADAVAVFESHCMSAVDPVLARLRIGPDVIAEVKQRVRHRALVGEDGHPRIADFAGRGDLRGWVRVMAVREALRMTQLSHREIPVNDIEKLQGFMEPVDAELENMKALYRDVFARAFDRALSELRPRDQTLLRQHVIDGLNIDQLGALYHVHRATAARGLERIRRAVLSATRTHMRQELHIRSTDLNSILRMIRSRLDVTLRALFRRPGD